MKKEKKTPEQKQILKLEKTIKELQTRNEYLKDENIRHETRQDYEKPKRLFNYRETVRKTVETLLIPALISIIYYSIK